MGSLKEKDFCYGSKAWADCLLRIALKDVWGRGSRVLSARLSLILYCRDQLVSFKFPWHIRILNFQIHRAQRNGVLSLQSEPAKTDPPSIVGVGGVIL